MVGRSSPHLPEAQGGLWRQRLTEAALSEDCLQDDHD